MNKKSDYDVAIENAIKIPKFYLGQEVETPDDKWRKKWKG